MMQSAPKRYTVVVATETESQVAQETGTGLRIPLIPLVLVGFCVFYFSNVLLRASEKYFWYDELFTVYLCRFQWHKLADALAHAIDSNPPLFYLLTKTSERVFGENLIGSRVPAMLGFWTLCLCLFRFVQRKAGTAAGIAAMLFPLSTGAFYYAYEARPHGIVLGFCGLAIVCWQNSLESSRRVWNVGLSLSLLAAFLTHCYALVIFAPFAIAEGVRTFQSRRINRLMWIAILAPAVVASATYVPLLYGYSSAAKGTNFPQLSPPVWSQIPAYYVFLIGPCIGLVVLTLTIIAAKTILELNSLDVAHAEYPRITLAELTLALSFVALPIFGLILGKVVHAPYYARYFLSTVAGFSLLFGLAVRSARRTDRFAIGLALVMMCVPAGQLSDLLIHRLLHIAEPLSESSSGFTMNSSVAGPLDRYALLMAATAQHNEPVGLLEPLDFLYLVNYAPNLRSRLYYVRGGPDDFFYQGFQTFLPFSPISYNPPTTPEQLLRLGPDCLVYAAASAYRVAPFVELGARIKSMKVSNGHFAAEMEVRADQMKHSD